MAVATSAVPSTACPVCGSHQPRQFVEHFRGGTFAECAGCRIQFAEVPSTDLQAYYREVWSDGNLGCQPYTDKVQAVASPALLARLLRTVPRFRWALSQLRRLPPGARVLDVGCGEGALLWAAGRLGLEPHGCDLAEPAVELARQLVEGGRIHVGTIAELPYPPASFDCLVALEVIEHLPNPRPFVESASRLLRPGGRLLLTTPNRHRLFAVLKRSVGRPHSSTDYPPHHYTRWSAGALRQLLERYFCETSVGSLPYQAASGSARILAHSAHLLGAHRMGQSLWATATGVKDRALAAGDHSESLPPAWAEAQQSTAGPAGTPVRVTVSSDQVLR
jgi:2-polyprenyl-3-methyl-5-hydroxy-6-metoxy-1,4-benzoquinol methylase